ncbi:MAG: nucleotide exchange factor GrpE [Citromicrobium sp.]|nr:nucleotide exchange factor GrpE [Citromicrobium sp.]MAO96254.1 nucleotide exchange factor GrpE [Citromicrobium sp.]MBT47370.1 nucleotide exchange factor GrpE [Citromicrobium sp.]|tara:strand:- start:1386 stop:2000 length:615 start_codon:yes stop_codon:yes gene_type:complete
MQDEKEPKDEAVSEEIKLDEEAERELAGVPEHLRDQSDDDDDGEDSDLGEALAKLKGDLETARQEVLYARAETQNVRRRLEKDIADTRAYAATGFARDILSVSDNLVRAIESIPQDLRDDDKFKGLVAGIEATQRELERVFSQHGVTRVAAKGLPLDPNVHQAMMEIPSDDAEPGTVIQEMQAGYLIRDRLLRPALVGVAKKPD